MVETKEAKLKIFAKEQVKAALLKIGRRLTIEKGPDFLTARKLSEAANTSVGTIYNAFSCMDNFILLQNMQTLDELYAQMNLVVLQKNPFVNLNRYIEAFSSYVIANSHLWMLLYEQHLHNNGLRASFAYVRKFKKIECLIDAEISKIYGNLSHDEQRVAAQVLEMALFSISGFLTTSAWGSLRQVNKSNICKLLLNTYLAGLATLRQGK